MSKKIRLIAVRHGESEGNLKELIDDNSIPEKNPNHLSQKGKSQAKELVKKLENYTFDLAIVSPLVRTKETIQPYLENKKIKVIVSALTSERDAGTWAGQNKDAIKNYCLKNNLDRVNFKPEKGESILEVYSRAKKFLEYLRKEFEGKTVLLCGHVNFLNCLDILTNKKRIEDFYSYTLQKNREIKEYNL